MARPMGHIRIMMSARVLLDLEKADEIYRAKGADAYTDYLRCRGRYKKDFDPAVGGRRLQKGPLHHFAAACLKLNEVAGKPLVEIGLSCKDEQESALAIFRNIDLNGLGEINFRRATAGQDLSPADHEAFGTDMLLTRNRRDAQNATDIGIAAAAIHIPAKGFDYRRADNDQVRLWVDGDAVAFGSSAEVRYRTKGLEVYRELEDKEFDQGIEAGPFTEVLAKISQLNAQFPRDQQPFEIVLVTARGANAGARALTFAEQHGFKFNGGMYFLGGASKAGPLKAHKPDLFLDDQLVHLEAACDYCPTGLVAYPKGSPMYEYSAQQKADADAKDRAAKTAAMKEAGAEVTGAAKTPEAVKPTRKRSGPAPKL